MKGSELRGSRGGAHRSRLELSITAALRTCGGALGFGVRAIDLMEPLEDGEPPFGVTDPQSGIDPHCAE